MQRKWETYTPEKRNEFINTIVTAAQKANSEITETLEEIDVLQEPKSEVITVKDFIQYVIEKNHDLLASKNIGVDIVVPDESPSIYVDRRILRSPFNTFILNSDQSEASEIRMWYRVSNGYVTICLGDNGKGMTPEDLAKCLDDKFSTRGSSGKGLSNAKQNIENCGGVMEPPWSEVGKGTIMAASFPLTQQAS